MNSSNQSLTAKLIKNQKLFIAVKGIIALLLLIYISSIIKVEALYSAFLNAELIFILSAFLLLPLNLYIQFWKWKEVCNLFLGISDNKKIWGSVFIGFSSGIFTPGRLGEYFGRGIALREKPMLQVTAASLIEKFFALVLIASLGSGATLLFLYAQNNISFYSALSLFILLFTFFYLFMAFAFSKSFWSNFIFAYLIKFKKTEKLVKKLDVFRSMKKRNAFKLFAITLLFFCTYVIQFGLLMLAFSPTSNFINNIWGGVLMIFTKTILPSISFGDLGIREGASVYFLTQLGEAGSAAFNASIFLFLMNVLFPSLIGLIYLFKKNES